MGPVLPFLGSPSVLTLPPPLRRDPETGVPGGPAYETYLHRVGRSGRFGRLGAAFNLADLYNDRDINCLHDIATYFGAHVS